MAGLDHLWCKDPKKKKTVTETEASKRRRKIRQDLEMFRELKKNISEVWE